SRTSPTYSVYRIHPSTLRGSTAACTTNSRNHRLKRRSDPMRAFVLLALLASSSAWAGDKKPAPTPAPASPTSAEQNQAQGQLQGQLQGQAQGQDQQQAAIAGAAAGSLSTATGVGHGGAGGTGIGGAGGNSGGNTFENSTSFDSRDRALALALPGQTGAPAVTGECLEHLRGGSGASIGVSGRTRINREC